MTDDDLTAVEAEGGEYIDPGYVGVDSLTNVMSGKYSSDFGIKTAGEIVAQYQAKKLVAKDPMILINLNRLFRRDMTVDELYESTRKAWVVGERREKAIYAVPHWRGLTREVYEINQWYQALHDGKTRWAFNGEPATN